MNNISLKIYCDNPSNLAEALLGAFLNNNKIAITFSSHMQDYFSNMSNIISEGLGHSLLCVVGNSINAFPLITPMVTTVFISNLVYIPTNISPLVLGGFHVDISYNFALAAANISPFYYQYIHYVAPAAVIFAIYLWLIIFKIMCFITRFIAFFSSNNILPILTLLSRLPLVLASGFNPRVVEFISNNIRIPLPNLYLILSSVGIPTYFLLAILIDFMTNAMFVRGTMLGGYPFHTLHRN